MVVAFEGGCVGRFRCEMGMKIEGVEVELIRLVFELRR